MSEDKPSLRMIHTNKHYTKSTSPGLRSCTYRERLNQIFFDIKIGGVITTVDLASQTVLFGEIQLHFYINEIICFLYSLPLSPDCQRVLYSALMVQQMQIQIPTSNSVISILRLEARPLSRSKTNSQWQQEVDTLLQPGLT